MDPWDARISVDLPRTTSLLVISVLHGGPTDDPIPNALNSNLTNPARAPFSNLRTRSVDLFFPLRVARKADSSLSTASFLVNKSLLTAELGI